jgi:hypothetical protein
MIEQPVKGLLYIEYQSFCLFVGIGFPHPLPLECLPSHMGPKGEPHSLAGEGLGGPHSDEGEDTLVLYVQHTIIPLRNNLKLQDSVVTGLLVMLA